MIQNFITKFSDSNNMVNQKLDTILTFKVTISNEFSYILDDLYSKSKICINKMLEDRTRSSSKYYKEIPCILSKSLISKYQKNKKLKFVKNLVLPICGDKGKQIKIVKNGIRIPALFKKSILPIIFPKPIIGFIRQVEFFKRNKKWFMSYSYNTPILLQEDTQNFIGIDRNSVGNVATIADIKTGKVKKIGPNTASITKNFRNRRAKLQKKNTKCALIKIRRRQSNRIKDINHKVSRTIVDYAKLHCSALVLENLGKISKKGKAKRYIQRSQWSFYQLETFIKYKAALLGVPIFYVNPAYTSQICSRCGKINIPNGKQYKCFCGHFDHRDANAAFNISANAWVLYKQTIGDRVPIVGYIDVPPTQRVEKAIQLESLGTA